MTESEYKVVEAMELYGGSFVKQLGKLFYLADAFNFVILKDAFPEYWKQYEDMAIKR